jgi:phosphate transport system substrate-binding protein
MAVISIGFFLIFCFQPGITPPFVSNKASLTQIKHEQPQSRQEQILKIGGSGSNLPLTRALTAAFKQLQPDASIKVYDSIGSTGGIRATYDGVIQLGLISRQLKPVEQALGLIKIPYARVATVIAVHPSVAISNISREQLFSIFRGDIDRWPNGLKIIVFQRERGDSGHLSIDRLLPQFYEINQRAYRANQWQILYRDSAMQEALMTTEGAIGVFDRGAIVSQRLPIRILNFEGISPLAQHIKDGTYPFFKELSFVAKAPLSKKISAFLQFISSKNTQSLIYQLGYIPLHSGSAN